MHHSPESLIERPSRSDGCESKSAHAYKSTKLISQSRAYGRDAYKQNNLLRVLSPTNLVIISCSQLSMQRNPKVPKTHELHYMST